MKKLFIVLLALPITMYGMECQEMVQERVNEKQSFVSTLFANKDLFKNTVGALEKVPDMDRLLAQYILKDYPSIVAYLLRNVVIPCEMLEKAPCYTEVKCGLSFVTESSLDGKQTMKISDSKTGAYISTIETYAIHTFLVATAEDKVVTWSGYDGDKVNVWDVQSGKLLVSCEHKDIRMQGFNKKGDQLVTTSSKGVTIWDIDTGKCLCTFDHKAHTVKFNETEDQIATISQKAVKIWDIKTGDCLHTLKGHTAAVVTAAFNKTGSMIFTGSYDKTAKVWDVKTGVCLSTLGGHTYSVVNAYFNEEGEVITIETDGAKKAWDIKIYREVEEFLTKKIVCMQAYILYAVYETMITRTLIENREKNGSIEEEIAQEQDTGTLGGWFKDLINSVISTKSLNDEEVEVVYPPLKEITFNFNRYPYLEQYYASMPTAIQDTLALYVARKT